MKKTIITLAIILGIALGASAQNKSLFDLGPERETYDDNYSDNHDGGVFGFSLPTTHGSNDDVTDPLDGGALLLIGFGAAYVGLRRKNLNLLSAVLLLVALAFGQTAQAMVSTPMTFEGRTVSYGNTSQYTWYIHGFLGSQNQPSTLGNSQTFNNQQVISSGGNSVTIDGKLYFAEASSLTDVTTGSEVTLVFESPNYWFYGAMVKTLNNAIVTECTYSISNDNHTVTVTIPSDKTFGKLYLDCVNHAPMTDQNTTISGIEESYVYNGSAVTPVPTVTYGTTPLIQGTDYTVSYANNNNFGTGTVIVTGTGNYIGSVSKDFSLIPDYAAFWGAGNDGSEAHPYTISTTAGLDMLSFEVNRGIPFDGKFFQLGDNITYSYTNNWNEFTGADGNFQPIGYSDILGQRSAPFKGNFDGCGHTISGIRICNINSISSEDVFRGLFGYVKDGSVKNLVLDDAQICGYKHVGGIVGEFFGSIVENCRVTAHVAVYANYDYSCYLGGIVGNNLGNIRGCTSSALVSRNGHAMNSTFGGVIGRAGLMESGNHFVHDCFAIGASVDASQLGGALFGENNDDYPYNSSNYYHNCTANGIGNNVGSGNRGDQEGACQAYSITAGDGVSLSLVGAPVATYNVSGITRYDGCISYGDMIYAPSGATVTLNLEGSHSGFYATNYGTIAANGNHFTLTMGAGNTVITAIPCATPTGLAKSDITPHSATLSWNGNSEGYIVSIARENDDTWTDYFTINTSYTFNNLKGDTKYYVKVKGDCDSYGQSSETDTIGFTTLVSCAVPTGLHIVDNSITAHGATFAWDAEEGATFQYAFGLASETNTQNVTFNSETSNNTVTLTELEENSEYRFFLRKKCGEDDYSRLLDLSFQTLIACPAPTDLAVSDITTQTATLSWSGSSESYQVSYRTAAYVDGFEETFPTNTRPIGWEEKSGLLSSVLAGGSFTYGNKWKFGSKNGVFNIHTCLEIYYTNTRQWLISPAFTVPQGGNLEFDLALAKANDSNTPTAPELNGTDDRFVVLVTTDNKASWSILREWNNSGSSYIYNTINHTALGEHVSLDLSDYAGQMVRIAFYGESTVSNAINYIHIDNMVIGTTVPASAWQNVSTENHTVTLNNLTPATPYEVKLQGNCGSEGLSLETKVRRFTTTANSYTKSIVGYPNNTSGWHLVASPLAGCIPATAVTHLTDNTYDLYYFDQTGSNNGSEWKNYKAHDEFVNLEPGRGYLYANSADVTLAFSGRPYHGDGVVALAYSTANPNAAMHGWNLIGNPFITDAILEGRSFYRMNANGSELIAADGSTVYAKEGIFVKATSANETATFAQQRSRATDEGKRIILNVSQGNDIIDRAILRFDEGTTLPKFQIHEDNPKLYIPQDGKEYAIVSVGRDGALSTEIPVNFKAKKNGEYTLTVLGTESSQFSVLSLIDHLTGANIDLLTTPCYTFTAQNDDYASRFKLVFNAINDENEDFAFISNGEIMVNGDGIIQVIDMLGHVLVCRDAARHVSTTGMTPGVYVLRLVDEANVKTQKIVIR